MTFRNLLSVCLVLALLGGCTRQAPQPVVEPREHKPELGKVEPGEEKPSEVTKSTSPKPVSPPKPPNPLVQMTKNRGVVEGAVLWEGAIPVPSAAPAGEGERFVMVEGTKTPVAPVNPVHVSPKGGLANVVVWLVKPPAGTDGPLPPEGPTAVQLVQRKGNFVPHVQVARTGARLDLATSDDRAGFRTTGAVSFHTLLRRCQVRNVPLQQPGIVRVTSELHSWMTPAYVHVLDHPFHAITGPDGRFRLPAVPPGTYDVVLWHEGWGSAPVRCSLQARLDTGTGASIRWILSLQWGEGEGRPQDGRKKK